VQLVVAGPGVRSAETAHREPVSLLDMAATFLDFAGCHASGIEGISLRPTLETGARHTRKLVYSGLGNWRAVSDGRFKLVAGFREDIVAFQIQFAQFDPVSIASAKLFDLEADPWKSTTSRPNIRR
jgi:arylsulfatase A-like enzyme